MSNPINFIGAGPGSPDLLTLRGRDLIAEADVVLYAGSLVPEGVLIHASEGADIRDSAPMALDEIMEIMVEAVRAGKKVARVHSGDPSLYGAVAEQARSGSGTKYRARTQAVTLERPGCEVTAVIVVAKQSHAVHEVQRYEQLRQQPCIT